MTASTGSRAARAERNAQILALCGAKSFGLIAKKLGISRNVVAGVIFRATYPVAVRYASSNGGRSNKIGTGHHGRGPYAAQTLLDAWDTA